MLRSELHNLIHEAWTQKYKDSIDCSRPRGFSQRAHCQGKKKINENYILKQLENDFPVEIQLYDHGTHWELDKIVVPGGMRGVGIGSEVLTKIGEHADELGISIFLTPSTSYGGTSIDRLKRFYKRFGFEKVSDHRDKALSKNMLVRHPHST